MTTSFSVMELRNIIENKSKNEAKDYIISHIIPLLTGLHLIKINGEWEKISTSDLRDSVFNRIPKEYSTFYFKEYTGVRQVVYEFGKPEMYDDKLNMCKPTLHKKNPDFKISTDVLERMSILEDYMKNILCSGSLDCYRFLIKWLANVVRGNKNNSCLYLKGAQGTGKSSLYYFMSKFVIGSKLCIETGSDPIRTKFNEILGGKILVSIEELENFSKGEWESISSTLKRMITSDTIVLQNKGTKSYEVKNLNNYILCSNNDAIKDDDGRRYFILDISTSMIGNRDYYKKLYEEIFTEEIGETFFQILMKIDLTGFNPQDFPLTQSKIESIVMRLDCVSRFIKEEYVLTKKDINKSCAELFEEYLYGFKGKKISAIIFHKKLSELGIDKRRKGTKLLYIVPNSTLLEIAQNKNWLTEFDEFKDGNLLNSDSVIKTVDQYNREIEHDQDI